MKSSRVVLLVLSLTLSMLADDEGHHHEDLTPQQLGVVNFPVSCAPAVQKPFERGVALLHSFWYEEAQKEFEDILRDDPACAMAHWGTAMSRWHQLWNNPDASTIQAANQDLAKGEALTKTERERDYLAALATFYAHSEHRGYQARATAYSNAMKHLYQKYPDDREAAAFYALSLLASAPDNDKTFANRKKAAEVLEKLFAVQPDHPGVAHYLIHSYDKPQLAELGLPAARRYAKIAPSAPHALHMPSHIFARLGLWQDDIDSNVASIAATRKTAAMHMGGEGHQFHAMDFLVYAYLQCGREADAKQLIEEIRRMPEMKDTYGMGFDPRSYALATLPARYDLELHRWSEVATLRPLEGVKPDVNAVIYWARAIGAARSLDAHGAEKDIAQLEAIKATLLADKKNGEAKFVEDLLLQARAWLEHLQGNDRTALKALKKLADRYDAAGEPGDIPVREMLADMLLDLNHPEEALVEYQKDLKFYPHRFNALYGAARAEESAGRTQQAQEYYGELVKLCAASESSRPELAHAKQLLARK